MDWITDKILIGDYIEAQDKSILEENGIRSILGLTRTLVGIKEAELGVEGICIIPLIDGPGNDPRWINEAIETLGFFVQSAAPVLVHCRAGRSRSPFIVAGFLMRTMKISSGEALEMIASKREIAMVQELKLVLEKME